MQHAYAFTTVTTTVVFVQQLKLSKQVNVAAIAARNAANAQLYSKQQKTVAQCCAYLLQAANAHKQVFVNYNKKYISIAVAANKANKQTKALAKQFNANVKQTQNNITLRLYA